MRATHSIESVDDAVAAVARIGSLPFLLKVICQSTGMGFAAVARVTEGNWTACAVLDTVGLGIQPGSSLAVETTLCREVREQQNPIAFDHASEHPVYGTHPTPRLFGFESYLSVPIVLPGGLYFGNLCALDPRPAKVDNGPTLSLFQHFAELIALELERELDAQATRRDLAAERASGVLREEFIAVLAHDIRNPLGAIEGSAFLISVSPSLARTGELAVQVARSAKRIRGMTDDLLDVARGRLGGGMALRTYECRDAGASLEDVVAEIRTVHPDRDIRSTIDVPEPIHADRSRLQQLLSNLVANAVDHGSAHEPIVVTASTATGALRISVRNGGEPIPAEHRDGLFQPFQRPAGAQRSGLGLGLYIAKVIAEAHGGELGFTSDRDAGTVFTATLPIGPAAHGAAERALKTRPPLPAD